MLNWKILLPAIIVSIGLFVYARIKRKMALRRIVQPFTTILIIVLAASGCFSPNSNSLYTIAILFGLIFCLVGDSNLVDFKDDTLFLIAVGYYWGGLVMYSITITQCTGYNWPDFIAFIILLAGSSLIIYFFLWDGMGKMRPYMIVYMLTWCYLLSQSLTVFWSDRLFFNTIQQWLLAMGTGIFFLGDIVISFHQFNVKFKKKPFWLDIPLYFTGQALIALSVSFF